MALLQTETGGRQAARPSPPAPMHEPWTGRLSPRAIGADNYHCFRPPGRLPNRAQWPGRTTRIGGPLDRVITSCAGSLAFFRCGLHRPAALGGVQLDELARFRIHTQSGNAAVDRHGRDDNDEAAVTAVFQPVLGPGSSVLDLDANVGCFTMLSAEMVGPSGSVVAVEPNPVNARLIEASPRANGFSRVTVIHAAAGPAPGLPVLRRTNSNGATSAPPDDVTALFNCETDGCVRADTLVPEDRRIDLIKVDVEGAEYLALSGCAGIIKRDRPAIVTGFSPSLMPGSSGISGRAYLDWLIGLGYRLRIVMPDGSLCTAGPDAMMAEHAARGTDHLDLLAEALIELLAAPKRQASPKRLGLLTRAPQQRSPGAPT